MEVRDYSDEYCPDFSPAEALEAVIKEKASLLARFGNHGSTDAPKYRTRTLRLYLALLKLRAQMYGQEH